MAGGWWCAAAPISPATSDRTAAAQRNVRHVIRQLLSDMAVALPEQLRGPLWASCYARIVLATLPVA